jgi:hypothetical protein
MPIVRLISLHCRATEDWTGPDEAYLHINGEKVWGPQSMNDEDTQEFNPLVAKPFTKTAEIKLYDQDTGVGDSDDHLGTITARASEAGKGEQRHRFKKDGANYTLTYEVQED